MDSAAQMLLVFVVAMLALFALVVVSVFLLFVRPWLRAFLHGAPVSIVQIAGMRLRGNPPSLLIDAYIALKRADVVVTIGQVENVYIDARNRVSTSDELTEIVEKRVRAK